MIKTNEGQFVTCANQLYSSGLSPFG